MSLVPPARLYEEGKFVPGATKESVFGRNVVRPRESAENEQQAVSSYTSPRRHSALRAAPLPAATPGIKRGQSARFEATSGIGEPAAPPNPPQAVKLAATQHPPQSPSHHSGLNGVIRRIDPHQLATPQRKAPGTLFGLGRCVLCGHTRARTIVLLFACVQVLSQVLDCPQVFLLSRPPSPSRQVR